MRRLLALGLGCLASFTASSEDLLTIFDQAVINDPSVREAEFTRQATREARPQAWAAYLPQINGSYNKAESEGTSRNVRSELVEDPANPARLVLQEFGANNDFSPESSDWGIQLRQTIFSWQGLVALKQSSRIAAQADADYGVAQQDLALRVSTRYFDVLAALDNVQAQQASLDAISRQLEQADKRFEVGLIAITDVQEARAARDTAAADLIAAKRQLATSQEFLREITDMQYTALSTPRGTMPLAIPEPADPQKWVEASMEQNLALTSSRLGAEIARDDVRTAFGGHLPSIDLVVGKFHSESDDIQDFGAIPGVFDGGSAPRTSDDAIEELVRRRVLQAVGDHIDFVHERIRTVILDRMSPVLRRALHGSIGRALEALAQEHVVPASPERLAHHFTEAGHAARAIPYWQQAGVSATERSAHHEAISAFTKAIELLQALPASPEHLERELILRMNLVAPLVLGMRDWGMPEVEATFTRALELCRRIGDTPYLAAVLVGLSQFHFIRAEHRKAREFVGEALQLAEASRNDASLLEASRMAGAIRCIQGDLEAADVHLARALALYDPARHRSHALLYGQDPGVACASVASWNLWMRGFPDQALDRLREAVRRAERAAHPFSAGLMQFFAVYLHFHRGEDTALELAEKMLHHATEHGLYFWLLSAERLLGRIRSDVGEVTTGIAMMERCRTTAMMLRTGIFMPHLLGLEAELQGRAGNPDAGLALIAEAVERLEESGERFAEAELHRIRGELLLRRAQPGERDAEEAFCQAVAIARRQGARSWELRAATSLARLQSARGERAEARRVLGAIYDQFTEGFDTQDLTEAKALLEG